MLFQSTRTLVAYTARRYSKTSTGLRPAARIVAPARQFHSAQQLSARVGSEDKDSINREPTEYTGSGTDEQVAETENAAYDPNSTSPEEQQEKAAAGSNESPLDYSAANPNVSKPRPGDEGGAEHAPGERRTGSGGGSGKKNKKPT
ncbi:MAG: hypothetical protein M1816_004589 [Peltula sp. TS41687]|nr:MAG: hypothetical protein M1816_004589 [Peltula sp. TS41687]